MLQAIGWPLLLLAFVWWIVSYGATAHPQATGVPGGITCFYAKTEVCRALDFRVQLAGLPVYNPTFFWISAGMALVGCVLTACTWRPRFMKE